MNENLRTYLKEVDELSRCDKHEEAILRIGELSRLYPNEAWLFRTRCHINSSRGKMQAAIADISEAIRLCDLEPDFFYTRGILLFKVGNYHESTIDFATVIRLCDYHGSDYYREGAYFFRADAFVRLGEFRKAKEDCMRIRGDMVTWTDCLRSKADILADCENQRIHHDS